MLHYKKFGQAPYSFVLVHGFPSNHEVWNTIIPQLSAVAGGIAIDMPGVGGSKAQKNLSIDAIAHKIADVMAFEQISNSHLVGHSMGGYTILSLAQKLQDVQAISLVHSGANPDSPEKAQFRIKSINLMEKGELEMNAFISAMFQNFFSESFRRANPDIVNRYKSEAHKVPAEVLIALYNAILNRNDQMDFIQETKIPIQFIIGTEDTATTMKELLPQTLLPKVCEVSVYENCGHGCFEEYPLRLANDLIRFHNYAKTR